VKPGSEPGAGAPQCPIPCNLCGSTDVEQLGNRDRDGRPLRTTICRRCGLVWSNPRPSEEEVRRYYSREYRLDYKGTATPSLRQSARSGRGALSRSRTLAPFLKPADRVLDVGAGGGEVVYVLRALGFDASGLEPDEQYARHARESLGVPVETGFIQDVAFPEGSFDAITMYHALEHVEDPSRILETLRTWLKEEGRLVIEVPNVEALCMAPNHRFHFAHFYNFNRATLEALGRKAGLEPVRTTTSPDGGNLITVFKRAAGSRPAGNMEENYARVATGVRAHTAARYYSSRAPYAGIAGRLRAYLTDRSATRGCETPRQVLDALIKRSKANE
jgi:2-polyprenyl-3-methyl-5-hydroxy-6-metoxy-1,4-benzoquinol methylase